MNAGVSDAELVLRIASGHRLDGASVTTMIARLLAVEAEGDERLLADYTFQHTRTMPGPPGWEW